MNNLLQQKLSSATALDKEWSPSIFMQLDIPKDLVDFVPMLNPSNWDITAFLCKGYPSVASVFTDTSEQKISTLSRQQSWQHRNLQVQIWRHEAERDHLKLEPWQLIFHAWNIWNQDKSLLTRYTIHPVYSNVGPLFNKSIKLQA